MGGVFGRGLAGRGLAFFGMWGSLGMECGGAEDAEGLRFVSMPGEDLLEMALAVGETWWS